MFGLSQTQDKPSKSFDPKPGPAKELQGNYTWLREIF